MKKVLVMVLFCTMLGSSVLAQQNLFGVDPGFRRSFMIELDREEKMKVELMNIDQLNNLADVDSLVNVFMQELEGLKNTLSAPRHAKRIEMMIDGTGENKMKTMNWIRPEEYYVIINQQPGRLKYEQDTVVITGLYDSTGQFFRYTWYLNYYTNLAGYADGRLAQQVEELKQNAAAKWSKNSTGGYSPASAPHISANAAGGKTGDNDMLLLRTSLDVQNYRERFVPSVSFGMAIARRKNMIYQEFGIGSEFHFSFAKDTEGNSRTYINSFVTVSYGRGRETSTVNPPLRLTPYISVGYLAKPQGNVYEKNTFRIGVGRFFIGNLSTKIEPSFYVNGFFKSATPSLRIVQMF